MRECVCVQLRGVVRKKGGGTLERKTLGDVLLVEVVDLDAECAPSFVLALEQLAIAFLCGEVEALLLFEAARSTDALDERAGRRDRVAAREIRASRMVRAHMVRE